MYLHVCTKQYDKFGARIHVLCDGDYYTINEHELAALEQGASPADLELEPDEDAATED